MRVEAGGGVEEERGRICSFCPVTIRLFIMQYYSLQCPDKESRDAVRVRNYHGNAGSWCGMAFRLKASVSVVNVLWNHRHVLHRLHASALCPNVLEVFSEGKEWWWEVYLNIHTGLKVSLFFLSQCSHDWQHELNVKLNQIRHESRVRSWT